LWAATEGPGDYNAALRLLMLTGARRGEVGGMMWAEVNLERALWALPASRSKNGQEHLVPLSEPALAVLRALPRRGEYLFGKRGFLYWRDAKRALDKRLTLPGGPFVVHDIRRSVATGLAELEVQPVVIEAVLNHTGGQRAGVAGICNRFSYLPQKTAALRAWAEHLLGREPAQVIPFRA
jgi:integrase